VFEDILLASNVRYNVGIKGSTVEIHVIEVLVNAIWSIARHGDFNIMDIPICII